jgi:hypothetical protein
MFCPSCKSEFREGFTRCGSCDVDLVHEIPEEKPATAGPGPVALGALVDYCGFLSLEDAREARDRLRRERLPSEIVIRDLAGQDPWSPAEEEYWIRVPSNAFRAVTTILGGGLTETSGSESGEAVACSECEQTVGPDETFCPHCGAKFN